MNPVWVIFAYLAPVLWTIFLVRALAYKRFFCMPIWICYALMAVPFDAVYAYSFVQFTMPYIILGSVMRGLATIEAILLILNAVRETEGRRYAVMCGLWIGAAAAYTVLLRYDPRGWVAWTLTSVRVGCTVALLVTMASWAWYQMKQVSYCWLHGMLMLFWSASSAIASAFDLQHGKAARGDGWDLFAIIVRDLTLMGWIWLVGPRMFTLRFLQPRDIVLPSKVGVD